MIRLVILSAFIVLPLFAAQEEEWYVASKKLYYGIPVQVRFKGRDEVLAKNVWAFLEQIDQHFNDYRADTEVGKINTAGKGVYQLSPLMLEALQVSYQAHAVTDGAFDITVGPLRRLWKGAAQSGQYPTEQDIQHALKHVGMQHIWLDGKRLHIHSDNISIDFGGIIKGFAVDHALEMIRQAGKTDAMVQVGGETGAMGHSPRGVAHTVAIPNPKKPSEILHILRDPGKGYSGSTSGNYRLPILIEGKPYYHIFDPRSGKPCSVHVLSVSVVFPQVGRNALADALSTSGVVLEPQKFIGLVEDLGGSCLLIEQDQDGNMIQHRSQNWQRFVVAAE